MHTPASPCLPPPAGPIIPLIELMANPAQPAGPALDRLDSVQEHALEIIVQEHGGPQHQPLAQELARRQAAPSTVDLPFGALFDALASAHPHRARADLVVAAVLTPEPLMSRLLRSLASAQHALGAQAAPQAVASTSLHRLSEARDDEAPLAPFDLQLELTLAELPGLRRAHPHALASLETLALALAAQPITCEPARLPVQDALGLAFTRSNLSRAQLTAALLRFQDVEAARLTGTTAHALLAAVPRPADDPWRAARDATIALARPLAGASAAQMNRVLDTLDACDEDALIDAARQALQAPVQAHFRGLVQADWQTLNTLLRAREAAARSRPVPLAALADHIAAAYPHTPRVEIDWALALLTPAVQARVLRSLAGAHDDASPRLQHLTPLRAHLEASREFLARAGKAHPFAARCLTQLLPTLTADGACLSGEPQHDTESLLAEIRTAQPTTLDTALARLNVLAADIDSLIEHHRAPLRETRALDVLKGARKSCTQLSATLKNLADEAHALGLDCAPEFCTQLVLGAAQLRSTRDKLAGEIAGTVGANGGALHAQLLNSKGKFLPAVRAALNTLKRDEDTARSALGDLIERIAGHLRNSIQRNEPPENEAQLIEDAIAAARAEQDGNGSLEAHIDAFLEALPRRGSLALRRRALSDAVLSQEPAFLLNLADELNARAMARHFNAPRFAQFKDRDGIDKTYFDALPDALYELAQDAGVQVSVADLRQAVSVLIEQGGDVGAEHRAAFQVAGDRGILQCDSMAEQVCAIFMDPQGPNREPERRDGPARAAVLRGLSQLKKRLTALHAVPDIGPTLAALWGASLDKLIQRAPADTALDALIADTDSPARIADILFELKLRDDRDSLLTKKPVADTLQQLGQRAITGADFDSPGARAFERICLRAEALVRESQFSG